MKHILIITILSFAIVSCSYNKDEIVIEPTTVGGSGGSGSGSGGSGGGSGGGGSTGGFPSITYTGHTKVYFDKYCISCHSVGQTVSFWPLSTFSEVSTYTNTSGKIQNRVLNLGNMPPSGTASGFLTIAEKDTLQAWLDQGAPQ